MIICKWFSGTKISQIKWYILSTNWTNYSLLGCQYKICSGIVFSAAQYDILLANSNGLTTLTKNSYMPKKNVQKGNHLIFLSHHMETFNKSLLLIRKYMHPTIVHNVRTSGDLNLALNLATRSWVVRGAICCNAPLISSSVTGLADVIVPAFEEDDPLAGTLLLDVEAGSSLTDEGFTS